MTDMEMRIKLRQFIQNNFLLGRGAELKDEDSFMHKGIVDSTGIIEVVSFVETDFAIKVGDDDLLPQNLDSINNLMAFIKNKRH